MSVAAGLGREELESELAVLAAQLSAGMCRWLGLLGELDRRAGWANNPRLDERSFHLSGSDEFDLDYTVLALATIERRATKNRGDPRA